MRNKGFTLVELLLYSAVLATVGGLLTGVLTTSIRTQNIDNSNNEVTQQLDFVMGTVQRLVRDSSLIDIAYEGTATTTACSEYCTLRLKMENSADDPTIIRSDANGVYLKQGQAEEVPLTTNEIIIDNLIFTKTEVAGGHAIVQVDATFSRNTQNPRLATTRSLQSAISRVSAATFDSSLIPNANNSFDLGQTSPNPSWKNLFLTNNLTVGNDLIVSGGGTISGNGVIMGNLGIGTANSSTNTPLQVTRAGHINMILDRTDTPDYLAMVAGSVGSGIRFSDSNFFFIGNTAYADRATTTTGTELFRITSAGNVGIGTSDPDASAILDVSATDKGFLPPRLTTAERDAIVTPTAGLLIYNSDDNQHNAYDGTVWGALAGGGGPIFVPLTSPLFCTGYNYEYISGDRVLDLQGACGVPANVVAVQITMRWRDAQLGTFVNIAPVNTGNNVGAIFQGNEAASRWVGDGGVVPTDANGDIFIDVNGGIDAMKLAIWGYWLPPN